MQAIDEGAFRFAGYTLDPVRGCVRAGSRDVALRPKSFAVLAYLVANAGRLVAKDELIKSVWDDLNVADESVARCVSDIRQALRDADQRLIKTVTKRGYMFVAPVSRQNEDPQSRSPGEGGSLVVLRLANLSGDATQDCVVDGLTDGLAGYLSRISDHVIVTRAAGAADPRIADARQIGREANARYVLAGSYQHDRRRVRVSARLMDARTGALLWTEQVDSERTDMLDLQDNIVTRLARAIQIELAGHEAARISEATPTPADADSLARRGEAVFLKYGPNREETEAGYELCARALAVDPHNARALSILAEKFATRVTASQSIDRNDDTRRAAELISRALASEPDSHYAHHAKARLLVAQRRPEESLVEAERALALNPSFIPTYQIVCMVNIFLGRPHRIIEHADTAMQLSPLDPFRYIFYAFKAYGQIMLGQKAHAIENLRQAVANNPDFPTPIAWLAAMLALTGETVQARDTLRRYLALPGARTRTVAQWTATSWADNPAYLAFRAQLYEGLRIAGMPEE